MSESVLRLRGIEKGFVGVPVLRNVDLDLVPGEVHALVGENGAGKSTLLKVMSGVHKPDAGHIELSGNRVQFGSPREAQDAGISIIHQEFNLLGDRTVAENVFLGREPTRAARAGLVDRRKMESDTAELLSFLGEESLSPRTPVRRLPVAQQQLVEIVKALSTDAKVIAMDEPTAALADHEVELLYSLVGKLRARGLAVLYVSHRLREVFDLSQQITVIKDGAVVRNDPTSEMTPDILIRAMVGRPLDAFYPELAAPGDAAEVKLHLDGATNERVAPIDLELRAGEIVGVAGLQGSGRSALARAISGVEPFTGGEVTLEGKPVRLRKPRQAIRRGIAFVTEDRKGEGLALRQSVFDNAMLVRRAAYGPRGSGAPRGVSVTGLLEKVTVRARSPHQLVRFLSGGNQQKVVLAKWLATSPRVLVVDEPTRGIDVGAKQHVYALLRELAASGVAVLMVSSELPELIGMSDRVIVMRDGKLAGELPAGPSEEDVMALATGRDEEAA